GGRTTSLQDYDYEELSKWFLLTARLDKVSNHIPYIAAYYFGSVQTPEKLTPLLEYLREVGRLNIEGAEKWRWLAHAAFLARFRMGEPQTALEIARELSALPEKGLPGWARQMPAFIQAEQ